MATSSNIEWTDTTWNPVVGCQAVSPGCAHCYAATMTRRLEAMGQADYAGLTTDKHFNGTFRPLPHKLDAPLRWRKQRRVFVNSMSDLFGEGVPSAFIQQVWLTMQRAHRERGHIFQVLTKRPERMHEFLTDHPPRGIGWYAASGDMPCPEPGIWLGVSAEDQRRADERIPWLLKTPAAVRFVSAEPLLGPINFRHTPWYYDPSAQLKTMEGVHWIIDGCESGPRRRAYNWEWSRSIQDQCAFAGVAYFRKQAIVNGRVSHDMAEWPEWARVRQFPKVS